MKNQTYTQSNHVCFKTHKKQSGFSLIEIMVAALVLSIGILGVVSLQVVGLKGTQQSSMKQQAMYVVQNLTERMRSNKEGVQLDAYAVDSDNNSDINCLTPIQDCSTATANCSAQDIATSDIHNIVCGHKAGTASRTGGIKSVAANDILTLVDGRLRVTCAMPGAVAGNCTSGELSIQVNWSERQIANEPTGSGNEDSLIVNTRISQ